MKSELSGSFISFKSLTSDCTFNDQEIELNVLSNEIDKIINSIEVIKIQLPMKKDKLQGDDNESKSIISIEYHQKLKGSYSSLLKSKETSKDLQLILPNVCKNTIRDIFNEIKINFISLFIHVYSNYFIHKMFLYLSDEDKTEFMLMISNSFQVISCNKVGTFALQRVIEDLNKANKLLFIEHFNKNVKEEEILNCCYNENGCRIVQKMIEVFREKPISQMIILLTKHLVNLSKDKHAIIVLKTLLVKLNKSKSQYFHSFKSTIEKNVLNILKFKVGNYLIHTILEIWSEDDMRNIISTILNSSFDYAMTKYSSSTIEKCLENVPGKYFLKGFIKKILASADEFKDLYTNRYGRFVILKVLNLSSSKSFMKLKDLIIEFFNNDFEKKKKKNWEKVITQIEIDYNKVTKEKKIVSNVINNPQTPFIFQMPSINMMPYNPFYNITNHTSQFPGSCYSIYPNYAMYSFNAMHTNNNYSLSNPDLNSNFVHSKFNNNINFNDLVKKSK